MNLARILAPAAMLAAATIAPAAATAPPAATAVVGSDGTLVRGRAVLGATHNDTGAYTVTFSDTGISANCAYTASVGSSDSAVSAPGAINVAAVSNGTISVLTYDMQGNAADRGFHVYVAC